MTAKLALAGAGRIAKVRAKAPAGRFVATADPVAAEARAVAISAGEGRVIRVAQV